MNSDPTNGTSPILAPTPELSHVVVDNGKSLFSTLGDLTGRTVQMVRHLPTTMREDLKTAVAILSVSNVVLFSIANIVANRLNTNLVINQIMQKDRSFTSAQVKFKNGFLNGLVTTVVVLTNFGAAKMLRYDPLQRPVVLVAIAAGTWVARNLIRPDDSKIEDATRQAKALFKGVEAARTRQTEEQRKLEAEKARQKAIAEEAARCKPEGAGGGTDSPSSSSSTSTDSTEEAEQAKQEETKRKLAVKEEKRRKAQADEAARSKAGEAPSGAGSSSSTDSIPTDSAEQAEAQRRRLAEQEERDRRVAEEQAEEQVRQRADEEAAGSKAGEASSGTGSPSSTDSIPTDSTEPQPEPQQTPTSLDRKKSLRSRLEKLDSSANLSPSRTSIPSEQAYTSILDYPASNLEVNILDQAIVKEDIAQRLTEEIEKAKQEGEDYRLPAERSPKGRVIRLIIAVNSNQECPVDLSKAKTVKEQLDLLQQALNNILSASQPEEEEEETGEGEVDTTQTPPPSNDTTNTSSAPPSEPSAAPITSILDYPSFDGPVTQELFGKIDRFIQLLTKAIDSPAKLTPTVLATDSPVGKSIQQALLIARHHDSTLDFAGKSIVDQLTLLRDTLNKIEPPKTE